MKLIRVHVKNFKSVHDSTPFEVHDVTCLVGKNESGKTAILDALYRLNPITEADGNYDVTDDYPRTEVAPYQQAVTAGTRKHDTVVEATFQLESGEATKLHTDLGEGVLTGNAFTLLKGYDNQLRYLLSATDKIAGKALLNRAALLKDTELSKSTWNTLSHLSKVLDNRAAAQAQKLAEQTAIANAKTDPTEKAAALAQAQTFQEP